MLTGRPNVCRWCNLCKRACHPVGGDWSNSHIPVFTRSSHLFPSCSVRNITERKHSGDGLYLIIFVISQDCEMLFCCFYFSCHLLRTKGESAPRKTSLQYWMETKQKYSKGHFTYVTMSHPQTYLSWVLCAKSLWYLSLKTLATENNLNKNTPQ